MAPVSAIGRNVQQLRQRRRWSQQMLAAHADVSVQTINNIESGRVYWPQNATISRIAHALGVPSVRLRDEPAADADTWQSQLTRLEQQALGARWIEDAGRFTIDASGTDSDTAAAQAPLVQQLHPAVVEKARRFSEISTRLDNAIGWLGVAAAAHRFQDGVQRPTKEIVAHLGSIYSAILELGSFLEQDLRLQRGLSSAADPLDIEVHRTLADLVRTAAPWLRQFPTIRDLDDQSATFLTRNELLVPGAVLISGARDDKLVSPEDTAAVDGLIQAARRGDLQGTKARTRSILSVRNLLYASAIAIVPFLENALASSYAEQSPLVKHSGAFLSRSEESIEQFIAGLPSDLRTAFQELIKAIKRHPDMARRPT